MAAVRKGQDIDRHFRHDILWQWVAVETGRHFETWHGMSEQGTAVAQTDHAWQGHVYK